MNEKQNTHQRVYEIADQLLALGQRPTQQSVRNELGSGSLTTINKALNDWWKSLGERLNEQRNRPDIPEPVFDSANTLWQQALAYAEHQLSEERTALEQQYRKYKHDIENQTVISKDEQQRLQELSDRLLVENERHLQKYSELQQTLNQQEGREIRLMAENRDLNRQLKEMEVVLQRLEQSSNVDLNQKIQTSELKISQLESENSHLDKHNQQLTKENNDLRGQLLDTERTAMKDKHNLELVISQQDLRHKELEQQIRGSIGSADLDEAMLKSDMLTARLSAKEEEVERLLDLLKSFNKDT